MADILGGILLVAMLFGLEVVALLILVLTAIYGRQLVFIIVCGVVAAVVMAGESFIWWICVAGHYEFGFSSETALIGVSAVSIVSLCAYFPVAIARCKRKQKSIVTSAA